jgi:hypothetical protein
VLGGVDAGVAVLLLMAIWLGLPARWWPVDVLGTLLALAFAACGVGLIRGEPWAEKVARIVGAVALGIGLLLVSALALTAAHISGLYGPIGGGGAALLGTIAALVLPYLVILPAAQLFVLARREPAAPAK